MSNSGSSAAGARGQAAHGFFLGLQDEITRSLASLNGGDAFKQDEWTRSGGGGGRSAVLLDGALFEKAGVNVSCVHGDLSESFARDLPGSENDRRFFATGISLVLHPRSAHVPTVHANFRYIERGREPEVAWFGGGADLTPWVLYEEDAEHFHGTWAEVCRRHAVVEYAQLKAACDRYFYLPHRGEARGIGGIFFDHLGLGGPPGGTTDLDAVGAFVRDAAAQFLESYLPIVERRRHLATTDDERAWQLKRRGRYVEFNLLHDRGTIFGLRTNGRIESILMSLPPLVSWGYGDEPAPGTYQERLVEVLRHPRSWIVRDDLDPSPDNNGGGNAMGRP
ncbi:MAG: oxygen-dependent coproporphyrinogen oxidase [Deltaproteobacteria bacterium]|nr:oxygen-dependent coproporphyrinogen oxidase [Deltaproteobacteria bacterium]